MLVVGEMIGRLAPAAGRDTYISASYSELNPWTDVSLFHLKGGEGHAGCGWTQEATCTLPVQLATPSIIAIHAALPSLSEWLGGTCLIDIRHIKRSATYDIRQWLGSNNGTLCAEWLPWFELRQLVLFGAGGDRVTPTICNSSFTVSSSRVGDILRWLHVNDFHITFKLLKDGKGILNPSQVFKTHATQFNGLLMLNLPDMVYDSRYTEGIRLPTRNNHPYALDVPSATPLTARLSTVGTSEPSFFPIHGVPHLLAAVQQKIASTSEIVGFHTHPDWID